MAGPPALAGRVVLEDPQEGLQGRDQCGNPVRFTAVWVIAIAWDPFSGATYVELLDGRVLSVPRPYESVLATLDSEVVTLH